MYESVNLELLKLGLISWVDFRDVSNVLYVNDKADAIYDYLKSKNLDVKVLTKANCIKANIDENMLANFDLVVYLYKVEEDIDVSNSILQLSKLVKPNGRMILGFENRLGLKYFCGDRDPYTLRSFDGIENYRNCNLIKDRTINGRLYSKKEIEDIIKCAGLKSSVFYSIFPNLETPQLVYSQDYLPNEELAIRLFPKYNYPGSVFLDEKHLYTDMVDNGLFHIMANAFVVECSMNNIEAHIKHATVSLDRGKSNAMMTIIRSDGNVEKVPIYKEARYKLDDMKLNNIYLEKNGLKVVEWKIEGNRFITPYVGKITLMKYLRDLFFVDLKKFTSTVDDFVKEILKSSKHIGNSQDGSIILEQGYPDLVPLNCFYDNDEFVFFDQEFMINDYPADVIIFRSIEIIYMDNVDMNTVLPKEYWYDKYNLTEKLDYLKEASNDFTKKLRNEEIFNKEFESKTVSPLVLESNRAKLNYPVNEYEKTYKNILDDIGNRKLILFGSGAYGQSFINQFEDIYKVCLILDNNKSKWGKYLNGVRIISLDEFITYNKLDYKIIICAKDYMPIVRQLYSCGIDSFSIYNPQISYIRDPRRLPKTQNELPKKKKYQVGYIAGVFDLFHIGHLNLLRSAKEYCEYLIAGVVSDEGVRKYKKVEPYIPFDERIDIVESCRYVDEAVRIPTDFNTTIDAFKMYNFDCQFSGSDYADHPSWLSNRDYLREHGSEMIFLPYTKKTSSSKLKRKIDSSLT